MDGISPLPEPLRWLAISIVIAYVITWVHLIYLALQSAIQAIQGTVRYLLWVWHEA